MREYDLSTVCKWIGNSPAVAARHYAVSVDLNGDFRRAAGLPETGAVKSAAVSGKQQESANAMAAGKNEKTPDNRGFDACCPVPASPDLAGEWAIQDSNL